MSVNFENKKLVVDEIKNLAKNAKCIALVDYKGLLVSEVTELRNEFRKNGCVYKVYKNRLLSRAFNDLGINFDPSILEGTTAVAFSDSDPVLPAKIAVDGETKYKVIKVKAGYAEGKLYDAESIKVLAAIPGKEILLGQLVGLLTNPMRSLAIAINEVAKKNA